MLNKISCQLMRLQLVFPMLSPLAWPPMFPPMCLLYLAGCLGSQTHPSTAPVFKPILLSFSVALLILSNRFLYPLLPTASASSITTSSVGVLVSKTGCSPLLVLKQCLVNTISLSLRLRRHEPNPASLGGVVLCLCLWEGGGLVLAPLSLSILAMAAFFEFSKI